MTKYICKCGRVVQKSTNADNTGNRDTVGCEGCPYLLPWGPMVWDDQQKGYTQDVKGYECRMSPTLEYVSTYHGRADDKCSLHIVSLDLDFLDEVQAWIYDNAADTLSAGFSRGSMRGTDFCNRGRYSLSVTCAQNKAGMAAKAALIEHFFGLDKSRRGMTPQQEKAHILAAIEAGKARAQKKEDKTLTYKDPATGWLYRVGPEPFQGSYWVYYLDPASSTIWKRCPQSSLYAGNETAEGEEEYLRLNAKRNGWEPVEAKEWKNPEKTAPSGDSAATMGESAAPVQLPKAEISTGCSAAKTGTASSSPSAEDALSENEPSVIAQAAPISAAPAFDYSGLDAQTVADLHLAEREYAGGKKMAEMGLRRMADAVAIAHDALCITDATICRTGGKFASPEQSFSSWCESMGLNRKAAERLLQVSKLMDNSSPREQKVLEELTPSVLYEASRPSAEPEAVEALKSKQVTTLKEYRALEAQIKAEREAREKAEQEVALASEREEKARAAAHRYHEQYEDAIDQRNRLLDEQGAYISRTTEAEERAKAAEAAAREAEKQRDGARDALQAAKLRGDQWQEKAEARQARIQELESRPIQTTAMDSDEVDRLVAQRMEEELARLTPRRQEEQEQAARDAYDAFILTARSLDNLWKALKPQISRLAPEQKTGAENLLLQKLMEVKEELIHACENCQS